MEAPKNEGDYVKVDRPVPSKEESELSEQITKIARLLEIELNSTQAEILDQNPHDSAEVIANALEVAGPEDEKAKQEIKSLLNQLKDSENDNDTTLQKISAQLQMI